MRKQLFFIIIGCILWVFGEGCRYPNYAKQARMVKKQGSPKIAIQADTSKSPDTSLVRKDSTQKNRIDSSQIKTAASDTNLILKNTEIIAQNAGDSSEIIQAEADSLDTLPKVTYAEGLFSETINYSADDSMIYDIKTRKIYLYGNAKVSYQSYNLSAGRIILDMDKSTASAEGITDSMGRKKQRPFFKDASQSFDCERIEYNFKTNKGKVYEASTQQGDGYFLSKATKFVSKGDTTAGSKGDDVIYSENCIYTTCNHYQPHFGIRGRKAKIIPNKLMVLGASYLEIMGMPTPIVLPFAFVPLKRPEKRKSGVIFSTNVEFSPTFGAGIRGIGYYWRISDRIDAQITGDIYMRGSFRLNALSNYVSRYKFKGKMAVGYSRLKFDERGSPNFRIQQDFNLQWDYAQDAKAHPNQTFNASVNFGTSDFFKNNNTAASQVLQSTFQSNVSFTKRIGRLFSTMVSASHSQNTQTRLMTVFLPRAEFRMNQIFPLKRKKGVGEERWYERIGFSYNTSFKNSFTIADSVLFATGGLQKVLDTMSYSMVHNPSVNMNFKLFKLINIQPNIRYTEYWFFKSQNTNFNPTLFIKSDTVRDANDATRILSIRQDTTFGKVTTQQDNGFYQVRDMSAGISMNTQVFFFSKFGIGRLKRMMALVRPSAGFEWRPDYTSDFWGYYDKTLTDTRYPNRYQTFRRFETTPAGGKSALLTYSLSGRLEGKVQNFGSAQLPDSSSAQNSGSNAAQTPNSLPKKGLKTVVLINNWSLSGNYNLAADSLRWSVISAGANTTLFKKIQLTYNTSLDPHSANKTTNTRINALEFKENKRLVRWTSMNLNLSTNLSGKELQDFLRPQKEDPNRERIDPALTAKKRPFFESMGFAYNLNLNRMYKNGKDTVLQVANELSLSGNFNLSPKWSFRLGRVGYDFNQKRITYPDFTFARDLHCWEMGLNWQPDPSRRTWAFYIRVKPSSLGFINIPARKTFFDAI